MVANCHRNEDGDPGNMPGVANLAAQIVRLIIALIDALSR
jgi:hypothetical protein